MNTHDVLAYSIATEVVRRVRAGAAPWSTIFSSDSYVTSSRTWPVPDFVLVDTTNALSVGAEFKPPQQSKREYLTGLGQAISYARDFHYSLLILPSIADDGYPIAHHVIDVLNQAPLSSAPVGVLSYNPGLLSPHSPQFDELRFFELRASTPTALASLDQSFYAKWREMGPEEMFLLLSASYDEMRSPSSALTTIRDRAFGHLWSSIQAGAVHHWGGGVRHYTNSSSMKGGVAKNYRNFLFHVGWTEASGSLTREGLNALHVGSLYGAKSRPFLDTVAKSTLVAGKHLILFNAISEFQDTSGVVDNESDWLYDLESFLENKGLLKRNPERGAVAVAGSARQFLKAEKQLWKNLELIIPRGLTGSRVFHPGRGFIFNWSRITTLLQE